MTAKDRDNGTTRWWEFYAVRYSMGTVVGAILFYLLTRSNTAFNALLFGVESTSPNALDHTHLMLLAAYGLVYCYIASAPILVFHAGRFLLGFENDCKTIKKWLGVFLVPPIIIGVAAYWIFFWCKVNNVLIGALTVFVLTCIIWLQGVAVCRSLQKSEELYAFYKRLAACRDKAAGGITDSYRHLREHGNSFFIVFLEIVLAAILYGTGLAASSSSGVSNLVHVVVLALWILPAVFVWVIGTIFERHFSDD